MKYVFGPVPSRRLGQSLGIDPVPFKTCNWNCVYCQLGRTSPLANERKVYTPPQEVLDEVQEALAAHGDGGIDWVTFVGSGEPTLHAGLGEMIRALKRLTPIPVAVLTNGSTLDLPEVRRDLAEADAVLPSLDAGSETLYRRINRPAAGLTLERLLCGLAAFRSEYRGRLWVEVMLLKGLNDTEEALADLARALDRIGPDEVHINLPVRPPSEAWVEPPEEACIARAAAILGQIARVVRPTGAVLDLAGCDDPIEAIVAVISRHPLPEKEIAESLARWQPSQVEETLRQLEASGRARAITRRGVRFWSAAEARYVDESRRHSRGASRPRSDN